MAEYIERSAILQKQTTMTEYDEGGWSSESKVVRVEDIESIPAADVVEVVHGHWDEGKNHGYCCCSNCRDVFILQEWLTDGKWNFCPNCGARMDGG